MDPFIYSSRHHQAAPNPSKAQVLLADLQKDVQDLLIQHLPNEQALNQMVDIYTSIVVGTTETETLKEFINVMLKEKPLGSQSRTNLTDALLSRVISYQSNTP